MDAEEKAFIRSKNILDKQHDEYLAYFEILVVSIATALVSANIFLFSIGDIAYIRDVTIVGLFFIGLVTMKTKEELEKLKQRLESL